MLDQLWNLLVSFLKIGSFSIGGGYAVIPLIREQVVDLNHWLTAREFTDIITISQMTPGPLAVNTSTFVGIRIAGIPGAVAATAGCVMTGTMISIIMYRFFTKHGESRTVNGVLRGLRSCSVGLIGASALTILLMAFSGSKSGGMWNVTGAAVFACSLAALRKWKMNPILLIAVTGASGLLFYL